MTFMHNHIVQINTTIEGSEQYLLKHANRPTLYGFQGARDLQSEAVVLLHLV